MSDRAAEHIRFGIERLAAGIDHAGGYIAFAMILVEIIRASCK
jgi:hypothetical protein